MSNNVHTVCILQFQLHMQLLVYVKHIILRILSPGYFFCEANSSCIMINRRNGCCKK